MDDALFASGNLLPVYSVYLDERRAHLVATVSVANLENAIEQSPSSSLPDSTSKHARQFKRSEPIALQPWDALKSIRSRHVGPGLACLALCCGTPSGQSPMRAVNPNWGSALVVQAGHGLAPPSLQQPN